MVTTTNDDMPERDAFGTDLNRVRTMLDLGYSERMIGRLLGITTNRARYAAIVATGDRQGAPTPEEIWVSGVAEIQAGWTEDMARAAKHGEPRLSSTVVRDMAKYIAGQESRDRHHDEQMRRRVESGRVPVYQLKTGEKRWQVKLQLRGRYVSRRFGTREEAEAWGRDWLLEQLERHQAEACCGK